MTKKPFLSRLRSQVTRFKKNGKGVAAVEFAFIFPIMLTLYLGSVEISGALQANKNVGKTSSMVGDLITQQDAITKSELKAIAEIGDALMFPYQETKPTITMIGIQVDDTSNPKARVVWSQRYNDGSMSRPMNVGEIINIPNRLLIRDTFLVRTTTNLSYKPLVTYSSQSNNGIMNMNETYYLRPRLSDTVTCSDC